MTRKTLPVLAMLAFAGIAAAQESGANANPGEGAIVGEPPDAGPYPQ